MVMRKTLVLKSATPMRVNTLKGYHGTIVSSALTCCRPAEHAQLAQAEGTRVYANELCEFDWAMMLYEELEPAPYL